MGEVFASKMTVLPFNRFIASALHRGSHDKTAINALEYLSHLRNRTLPLSISFTPIFLIKPRASRAPLIAE